MRRLLLILTCVLAARTAAAQHTLGFVAGYGSGNARFYPKQETRGVWGMYSGGLTWRYYSPQRFVGGVGLDLELVQQGFSYVPYASMYEDESEYVYYSRKVNSIMLPVVWQPHFYVFKRRMRIYFEAAATFWYNVSSTYTNDVARENGAEDWEGRYEFKTARDNRWGYGLAGGGGLAILIRRFEINLRARYYFGLGDLVRNRNKYAGNTIDGSENPFWATPLRSPTDVLNFSVGLSYRFNKDGFDEWKVRRPKREKNKEVFDYK